MVSVVIPFLNSKDFIKEAIDSVLAQTYDNWELLLVDDGSIDTSTEIALNYAKLNPDRVIYLEHPNHQNRGPGASRNLGSNNAKGKYIAFLDADDIWLPHKLEQQVAILEAQPETAMVYGPGRWWYSWTGNPEDMQHDYTQELAIQPNTLLGPPKLLTLFLQDEGPVPSPSGILVRREIIERVGGSEEACRNIYDDQIIYAKLNLEAPIYVAGECWYWYRQHPNQRVQITVETGQFFSVRQSFLNWLQEYLSVHGIHNDELQIVLDKEMQKLWPYRHPNLHRLLSYRRRFVGKVKRVLKGIARRTLPVSAQHWLGTQLGRFKHPPPVGRVRFGSLRQMTPIARDFGFERGKCIDRYYIERFLFAYAPDIRGRVLEVANDAYTRRFGGDQVTRGDVLHISQDHAEATIVADLTCADHIPSNTFDCIILTQTLQFIPNLQAAVCTLNRILKPGGVLLATIPGISQISRYDMDHWGDYWRFTTVSAWHLFQKAFLPENITVEAHGNVLVATAFLQGLAVEELHQEELDYRDSDYEVLITVRAIKPEPAL